MMNPATLKNLTLASAKHLVSQGHISPAHHKRIVKKIGGSNKAPGSTGIAQADVAGPGAFGSLNPVLGAGAGHYMSTVNSQESE